MPMAAKAGTMHLPTISALFGNSYIDCKFAGIALHSIISNTNAYTISG
jgi:hypothetical protein